MRTMCLLPIVGGYSCTIHLESTYQYIEISYNVLYSINVSIYLISKMMRTLCLLPIVGRSGEGRTWEVVATSHSLRATMRG